MCSIISRSTLSQTLAVMVKNMVLLGHGMAFAFPTILIPDLSQRNVDDPLHIGQEGISWVGSANLLLVPIGCILSGIVMKPLGRKRSLQLITIPFCIAWITYYFSYELWHILFALIISGFAGGLKVAPVLTYVAEVCEPRLRGTLISTSNVSITAGIMVEFILGKFLDWKSAALCSFLVPSVTLLLLFIVPETPTWLVSKRRFEQAKQSLAWLRGWVSIDEVTNEFNELVINSRISREIEHHICSHGKGRAASVQNVSMIKLMKKRSFIRAFSLTTFSCFLAHFCGLSPINLYAVNIFTSLGSPVDGHSATAVLGVVSLIGGVTGISIVGRLGRRKTSFISLCGIAIAFFVLGIYIHLSDITTLSLPSNQNKSEITPTDHFLLGQSNTISWFPFMTIIFVVFSAQTGICLLPWTLMAETFPNEIRDFGSAISTMNFYIFGFLCVKTFFQYVSVLTLPGTFWFFSAVNCISLVILYFTLPETEGKTLYEIEQYFSSERNLRKSMNRDKRSTKECFEQTEKLHRNES